MLPIPSYLMDKIKQAMQTIGNNAEPKMTILAQKAAKFLTQGSFLNSRTVRTGNSLGPLDICIRREIRHQEPTEIVMAYIEDGLAKVATLPYVHTPDIYFTYQYTIGPATDVACDFDGRWSLITDRSGLYFDTTTIWELITFGEPYIVTINNGLLTVRSGQGNSVALANDTTKCAIIRGWKAQLEAFENDQGMLCAYIKNDTKVYYRNYCEQSDTTYIWESEKEVTTLASSVASISLFRTADYRIGFLSEASNEIHMLLTKRSWSGMASLPEYTQLTDIKIASLGLIKIYYSEYSNDEKIKLSNIVIATPGLMSLFSPSILHAENRPKILIDEETEEEYEDWGRLVAITFTECITNAEAYPSDFVLEDIYGSKWYGQEVYRENVNSRTILVTFGNFNNAANDITVKAVAGNLWNGLTMLEETYVSITAIGLVPVFVPSPEPLSIENIQDWSGSL